MFLSCCRWGAVSNLTCVIWYFWTDVGELVLLNWWWLSRGSVFFCWIYVAYLTAIYKLVLMNWYIYMELVNYCWRKIYKSFNIIELYQRPSIRLAKLISFCSYTTQGGGYSSPTFIVLIIETDFVMFLRGPKSFLHKLLEPF